jgi:hypothetical protein
LAAAVTSPRTARRTLAPRARSKPIATNCSNPASRGAFRAIGAPCAAGGACWGGLSSSRVQGLCASQRKYPCHGAVSVANCAWCRLCVSVCLSCQSCLSGCMLHAVCTAQSQTGSSACCRISQIGFLADRGPPPHLHSPAADGNLRPRPIEGHQPTYRRGPPQMHRSGHSSRTCPPAARSRVSVR